MYVVAQLVARLRPELEAAVASNDSTPGAWRGRSRCFPVHLKGLPCILGECET